MTAQGTDRTYRPFGKTRRRSPRRPRRSAWTVLAVLLAGVVGVAFVKRLALATWALGLGLGALGLDGAGGQVIALDPDRLVIRDLRLGTGHRLVEQVAITAPKAGLLRGRIETIRIEGLHLLVSADDNGIGLPGLEPLYTREDTPSAPIRIHLPGSLRSLDLSDGRITLLDSASGEPAGASLSLEGEIRSVETRGTRRLVPDRLRARLEPRDRPGPRGLRLQAPCTLSIGEDSFLDQDPAAGAFPSFRLSLTFEDSLALDTPVGPEIADGLTLALFSTPPASSGTPDASASAPAEVSGSPPPGPTDAPALPPVKDGPPGCDTAAGDCPGLHLRITARRLLWQDTDIRNAALHLQALKPQDGLSTGRLRGVVRADITRLPGEDGLRVPDGRARPLRLEARIHPAAQPGGSPTLEGSVGIGLNAAAITLNGTLEPDPAHTTLRVHMPLTPFSEALHTSDLHGLVAERLHLTEGGIGLEGTLDWDGDSLHPDLRVALEDLSGRFDAVAFRNLSTTLSITRFWPLDGRSTRALASNIDPGVPLTDGEATWRFDGRKNILIQRFLCRFAGAAVTASNIVIPLVEGDVVSSLNVDGVSLEELSRMVELDALEARGFLSGTIPFRVKEDGTILVNQAELHSTGPGILRYRFSLSGDADEDSGSETATLLSALDNFHFRTLDVTLTGSLHEELKLGVFLAGSNPTFLDGYPIELKATLDGPFLDLIGANLYALDLPKRIRGNLDSFLKGVQDQPPEPETRPSKAGEHLTTPAPHRDRAAHRTGQNEGPAGEADPAP